MTKVKNMIYRPHEQLTIQWNDQHDAFNLALPWLEMDIDVDEQEKPWIRDATQFLHLEPARASVQRFIGDLKEYPLYYYQPRLLSEFDNLDLQDSLPITVDCTTPQTFINTVGITYDPELLRDVPVQWSWDWNKIMSKAHIADTDLYDPLSLVSYLICYRSEWESHNWAGQDGLGQILERYLQDNEQKFFQAIGWISKQSWYVTMTSGHMMSRALPHFTKAVDLIEHYIKDEAGHYKFMEQVLADLELNKDDFEVGLATKWFLAAHGRMAELSPLSFSAMINLFEAAYYEGQDPISRVIKMSSKPYAAKGFDLHYKINQEHRHCDMPLVLAQRLTPQTTDHVKLTLCIFELTLILLDNMEQRLDEYLKFN